MERERERECERECEREREREREMMASLITSLYSLHPSLLSLNGRRAYFQIGEQRGEPNKKRKKERGAEQESPAG